MIEYFYLHLPLEINATVLSRSHSWLICPYSFCIVEPTICITNYDLQGRQFDKVSKLIKVGTEDLEMERAGIITSLGGFDTHSDGNINVVVERQN